MIQSALIENVAMEHRSRVASRVTPDIGGGRSRRVTSAGAVASRSRRISLPSVSTGVERMKILAGRFVLRGESLGER